MATLTKEDSYLGDCAQKIAFKIQEARNLIAKFEREKSNARNSQLYSLYANALKNSDNKTMSVAQADFESIITRVHNLRAANALARDGYYRSKDVRKS